jgi:hypothetical protein
MGARAPAQILGGLPIIAEVSFGRDYFGEYWEEVDHLYWRKRDGTAGKEIPQHIRDKAEACDYGLCNVIEQVNDYLAYEQAQQEDQTPVQFFETSARAKEKLK